MCKRQPVNVTHILNDTHLNAASLFRSTQPMLSMHFRSALMRERERASQAQEKRIRCNFSYTHRAMHRSSLSCNQALSGAFVSYSTRLTLHGRRKGASKRERVCVENPQSGIRRNTHIRKTNERSTKKKITCHLTNKPLCISPRNSFSVLHMPEHERKTRSRRKYDMSHTHMRQNYTWSTPKKPLTNKTIW